jgi:LmbE family N-acetylglucosaminyl deacetylase
MMFMGFVVSLLFRNYRMAAKPFSVKSPTTNTRWNRVSRQAARPNTGQAIWAFPPQTGILAGMEQRSLHHVFLSPHLDDVALSCGGRLAALRWRTRGEPRQRVTVVTIFAGSPADDALTPFAHELKTRWGNAGDAVAVRRAEDLAAMQLLGAQSVHLGLLDCVYRQDATTGAALYSTREHIFGEVHPYESPWPPEAEARLREALADLAEATTVYAPLAAGHHVDHQIVQRLAFALTATGQRLVFYEDYPYAGDAQTVREAQALWPQQCWQDEVFSLDEEELRRKGDAVACYASQISTFWPDAATMREALHAAALRAGSGTLAERYWHAP